MEIIWADTAKLSYAEELDFIFRKWGNKEVDKFITLSEEFLEILKSGFIQGKPTENRDAKLFVISKQTTLVYKIDEIKNRIELILFWNNLKDPNELKKLLYSK